MGVKVGVYIFQKRVPSTLYLSLFPMISSGMQMSSRIALCTEVKVLDVGRFWLLWIFLQRL